MKLSALIKHLEQGLKKYGDIDCYSDHGFAHSDKKLSADSLHFMSACALLGQEICDKIEDDSDYILYIAAN